jgi:pimeloyl-ACP methyl ester carboxylesterase
MSKININGVSINYEVSGQGPALVLLHGWTENHNFWKFQIPAFTKDYMVVTIDLRGHGESDKPKKGYSIQTFADDVYRVLIGLKIKRAIIVGHSMGGMTALVFCLTYPDNVQALILVNTTATGLHETGLMPVNETLKMIRTFGFEKVAERFFAQTFFAPGTSEDFTNWAKSEILKTPQFVVEESLKAIIKHDVAEKLSAINVPTLIIHGSQDLAIDVKMAQIMNDKVPNSSLKIIEGVGHHPMLEKPEEFNKIVLDFLRKL